MLLAKKWMKCHQTSILLLLFYLFFVVVVVFFFQPLKTWSIKVTIVAVKRNRKIFAGCLDRHKPQHYHHLPLQKSTSTNSCTLHHKSGCPEQYEEAIIKNLLYHAKLICTSKTIFYSELKKLNNPSLITTSQIRILLNKSIDQRIGKHEVPVLFKIYVKDR